jgi:hypothetical protein
MELGKWKDHYQHCRFPYQLADASIRLNPSLQLEILLDPETPNDIIQSFSDGSHCSEFPETVRVAAAGHSKNHPGFLNNYRSDDSEQVRMALASNPIVLMETLIFLAGDLSSEVRENVSKNLNSNEEVIEKLNPCRGFVCISQSCLAPDTVQELKKDHPESDNSVTYSDTPMRPRWGSIVYRIESNGRLTFVSSDIDSSD